MKKLLLLFFIVLLIGCEEKIDGMVYLEDEHVINYNSNEEILKSLPGNLNVAEIRSEGDKLIINYKVRDAFHTSDSLFWDDQYKDLLLYNGGIMLKDASVREIMFFLETDTHNYMATIQRDDFVKLIGLPDSEDLKNLVENGSNAYYKAHSALALVKEIPC